MASSIIFDIMKYSIQDGPGIRTTVFFKGCPLSCWWCHNPESQSSQREILFSENKCIDCGDCDDLCCTGARELVGREMTIQELMTEIEKDLIFYEESGGGVTFSGGEPLTDPVFLNQLLEACKKKGIHTCVDTTGHGKTSSLLEIASKVDLFLFDLKFMDSQKHLHYTGVSNELILNNLRELSKVHQNINIRFPLIPGINDDQENIIAMGKLLKSLPSITRLNILPYHNIGNHKYKKLGRTYQLPDQMTPGKELVDQIKEQLMAYGLQIKIGG